MHVRPPRPVRLGLPTLAVLALALGGCGDPAPAAPPTDPPGQVAPISGDAGSDGLTVRYLADDGSVKTVGVEDFPR